MNNLALMNIMNNHQEYYVNSKYSINQVEYYT